MRPLFFLALLASISAHAQTRQEAINFLNQNSSLRSLSCDSGQTKVWRKDVANGRTRAYRYSFDPRSVRLVAGQWFDPHSGQTSAHPRLQCHAGRCITYEESNNAVNLYLGRERESDNLTVEQHASVLLLEDSPPVDLERLVKAYNFLVESCGGQVKPSF